jgi:hypothetical protein
MLVKLTPEAAQPARSRRSVLLGGSTHGSVAGRIEDEGSSDRIRRNHFHWILAKNKKYQFQHYFNSRIKTFLVC